MLRPPCGFRAWLRALLVMAAWSLSIGRAAGDNDVTFSLPIVTLTNASYEVPSPQDEFQPRVLLGEASGDDGLLLPGEERMAEPGQPADEMLWLPQPGQPLAGIDYVPEAWCWQWSPTGLIYHSYMAGAHEPRMALVSFYDGENRAFWDATLGARVGLFRYGDRAPQRPQGYQLDFYGAAISRLDVEHRQDLEATDYVFGFPLTYGCGDWQYKLAYAHVSSHLGDEHAIRVDDSLDERINYVRDGVVIGVSHYLYPFLRSYGEVGWAFHTSGGAEPFEAQFGGEFAAPGETGARGVPFFALNTHLREEHDFGGDFALQTGWLRRGEYGQTLRVGLHFLTGKSSQFQFFDRSEEQLGLGIWYDL